MTPQHQNKESYIYNLDLYDKYYLTYVDTRFIENVLFSPSDSQFENDENDVLYMNLGPLKTGTKVSLPGIIDNYDCYRVQASDNGVVEVAAGIRRDTLDVWGTEIHDFCTEPKDH